MRAVVLTLLLLPVAALAATPTATPAPTPAGPAPQPLAASSPFLPPGVTDAGPNGAAAGGAIELRGEMSTPDGLAFCIYDTTLKKAVWVHEGEKGNPFIVKSHDLNRDSVVVTYQGKTMNLALPIVKVASSGPGVAPTVNAAASATPSAEDAQKLAAIAAEVARRRQLREQELQKNNGGIPTTGVPVSPGPQQVPSNGQPPRRRTQTTPPQ